MSWQIEDEGITGFLDVPKSILNCPLRFEKEIKCQITKLPCRFREHCPMPEIRKIKRMLELAKALGAKQVSLTDLEKYAIGRLTKKYLTRLAECTSRSVHTYLTFRRRHLNIRTRGVRRYTAEERELLTKMWDAGIPTFVMAAVLGLRSSQVRAFRHDNKLPTRPYSVRVRNRKQKKFWLEVLKGLRPETNEAKFLSEVKKQWAYLNRTGGE